MTSKVTVRRDSRADEARQLIRLRHKIKTANVAEETALLASLDKAAAELDAGKGGPIARVREDIKTWAKN